MSSNSNKSHEGGSSDQSENGSYKERFDRLFKGSIENDCEFIVGPQQSIIKGHKLFFSMASEVFHAMFYSQLKENSTIVIDDLDVDGFLGMKHFIYTNSVNFTSALQACSTYIAARKYIIPGLEKECIEYVLEQDIPSSEVLELYEFCKYNKVSEIEEKCTQIIQEETEDVVQSKYFLLADIHTIDSILRLNSLHLQSELEIFNHFERWATAEADRMQLSRDKIATSFNCIKKHIRFLSMSGEEFASGPAKSLLLTQEEKLAIGLNLIDFGSAPYPENFSLVQQERIFKTPNSEEIKVKHTFIVSLDENVKNESKSFDFCDLKWIISQGNFKEHIYFHVQPEELNEEFLICFKTKLRVLARMKKYDDLHFENESYFIYNKRTEAATGKKIGIISPVIPLRKLKNKCYMDDNDEVIISVSFLIENIQQSTDEADVNAANVNE